MMKNFPFGAFIPGFMLGALFTGVWFANSNALPMPFSSPVISSPKPLPESGAISVADQPAGPKVTIESITVSPPGVWVAVREMNGDELGNVLGAARVTGPRSVITVPLLRATEPGFSYAVELYRDDGGETFDLATDSVYVDFNTGAPVIARFMTTH